jgi:hypothetical protein
VKFSFLTTLGTMSLDFERRDESSVGCFNRIICWILLQLPVALRFGLHAPLSAVESNGKSDAAEYLAYDQEDEQFSGWRVQIPLIEGEGIPTFAPSILRAPAACPKQEAATDHAK